MIQSIERNEIMSEDNMNKTTMKLAALLYYTILVVGRLAFY